MFVSGSLLLRLPLDAKGRVGEQVVELLSRQAVLGEAVAELDVLRFWPLISMSEQQMAKASLL